MPNPTSSGHHAEDEPDIDGYDDSQRGEIAEIEGGGPTDGAIMTDMLPDPGGDLDEEEIEDGGEIPDDVNDIDGGFVR